MHAAPLLLLALTACTGVFSEPDKLAIGHRDIKQVFSTRARYAGGLLGGLDGADATCQATATDSHLTGTFKAWLSDSTASPATRFSQATVPYALINGPAIADSWADLIHADLDHAIDRDERGQAIADDDKDDTKGSWTGTFFDGTLYQRPADEPTTYTCGNWHDIGAFGILGDRANTDQVWTFGGGLSCELVASLYCFEQ